MDQIGVGNQRAIPPNHAINCIFEWKFQSDDKVFSLICLGIGDPTAPPNKLGSGRILFTSCRISGTDQRTIREKFIRRFVTKYQVYAIERLDDRRLVYSWGTSLGIITFEPRNEEEGHRFKLINVETGFVAPSPILHITVKGNLLYCSTLRDSLVVIEYLETTQNFRSIMSDPNPRLTTHHLVDGDEVLVADKEGNIVSLGGKRAARHASFEQKFQAHIGPPILRIKEAILNCPRFGVSDRIPKPAYVAVGIDGSVTLLKRCSEAKLGALRLVQSLLSEESNLANYDLTNHLDLKVSVNAFNVDALALCVERMSPGKRTVVKDCKATYLEELQKNDEGHDGNSVDVILAARKILDEEFGGLSL